jgi:hypothetical protein
MVKFLLPHRASARAQSKGYRCGNHVRLIEGASRTRQMPVSKILIESDSVKFDEISRRIRI